MGKLRLPLGEPLQPSDGGSIALTSAVQPASSLLHLISLSNHPETQKNGKAPKSASKDLGNLVSLLVLVFVVEI